MAKFAKLPSYSLLKQVYPGKGWTPEQVAFLIGGKVQQNFEDPAQPSYKLTCALRISHALNWSGGKIQSVAGVRMNSGRAKVFWFIFSVNDLEKYLRYMYGPPAIEKSGKSVGDVKPADFSGKSGIILFKSYHADLWNGSSCEYSCYFGAVQTVMLWEAS